MTVAFLLYILNERMKVSNSSSIKNKQLDIKKLVTRQINPEDRSFSS